MRLYAILVMLLISANCYANPFLVSDVLQAGVTQCGVYLDVAAKVTIPVTAVTGGNICKYDLASVGTGNHTVQLTAITASDPVWGSQESAKSSPLAFTRPAQPLAPSGLGIIP